MSVRRLAPAELQPKSFAFSAANAAWAEKEIAKYPPGRQASAVIPLLWRAQEQEGWVSQPAIETIAQQLGMANIRVLEVATFYTMFNLAPAGQYFIQLCGTTPCRLRGADAIIDVLKKRVGEQQHVTADGKFSWLEVECLGACCNAPMVQINQDYYEDLTAENFNALLDNLVAGKPVKVGPQNGRRSSEPEGGVTTLTDKSLYDGSSVGNWRKAFDERFEKAAKAKAEALKAAEAAKAAGVPAPAAAAAPAPAAKAEAAVKTADAAAGAAAKVAGHAPGRPLPSAGLSGATEDTPAATGSSTAGKAEKAAPPVKTAKPEDKPAMLTAPRTGKGDDLKLIWGVGPKLEKMLNAMGVFHFDQIAAWTEKNLGWVDENLEGFYGRARRDDWIGQSKKLSSGWRPENAVGDKPKA